MHDDKMHPLTGAALAILFSGLAWVLLALVFVI